MTETKTEVVIGKDPRRSILWLADDMESALTEHDGERGERGWENDSVFSLLERVKDEVMELELALKNLDIAGAQKECADAANFLMMVHDNLRQAEKRIVKQQKAKIGA